MVIMNKYLKVSSEIRRIILEKAYDCGEPVHLGGALSMVDLLVVLYEDFLNYDSSNPHWDERDIFILSKGHTVLGYLSILFYYQYFDRDVFDTFQKNASKLIAHPIKNIPYGIESSNGSLGQGISYGSGIALGFKKRNLQRKVFVMLGDGECNEGSVWEAAQLASEMELSNLVVIIDQNKLRNDGPTAYKNGLDLAEMWSAFGWNTISIDGHNFDEIHSAMTCSVASSSRPTAIVANTIKGKGFSLMENNNDWHHNRITKSVFEKCVAELEGK